GVALGVPVGVAVAVGVALGVPVGVAVAVGVALGVPVGVAVGVSGAVGVGDPVGVGVCVPHGTRSCTSSTNIPVRSPNPSSCTRNFIRTVCPARGVVSTIVFNQVSVSRH